ncbi:MAG TPA: hypothetical protein VEZ47_09215, partial [Gemmatirosa sp.]|nr:hypothetical protein [Gemmatirosa sp.]
MRCRGASSATLLCAAAALGAATAHAQAAAQTVPDGAVDSAALDRPAMLPDGSRRAEGQVSKPGGSRDAPALVPVAGVFVVLHRVGRDTAGALDSVRTDAAGRYAFRYRPSGAGDALYFASTSVGGIAYFSPPFRDAVVRGEAGEIQVFDTTSAAVPLTVRGRHLVVAAPDAGGSRNVIEVWELSNDTSLTVVPAATPRGVWSAPLPPGARDVALRPNSDIPAENFRALNGRATLLAPFAPGLRQVAYSYRLPDTAFPLRVPVERTASVLEILVEEPQGVASGPRLVQADPVTLEGRAFRRFLAQDVAPGAAVEVSIPSPPSQASRWLLPGALAAVGSGMLVAFVAADRRRRAAASAAAGAPRAPRATAGAAAPVGDTRAQLLAALA